MTNDSERVAASDAHNDRTLESETTAIVWPADLDGASTIRMQVLTDVPGAATTVDTVFDVSDGSGHKSEPFVTPDAHSAGWGVAWLESPEPGSPAQVKLTYVDQLGETTGDLTVHEETSAGAAVHQHDVVLSSFGSPDPRDPIRLLIDGINVVWISTELGPQDDPETASPYGRVMFQRYEVTPDGLGSSPHYKLEGVEHRFSSTANDNQPVELGFGRSPSVTKLTDGETAITWIDERDQIQGVFISDEIDNSRVNIRMRSLSPGLEQLRVGTSHAQGIGVAIGNMIALEFLRDTKFASLIAQALGSDKSVDKPGAGPAAPLPITNAPETNGAVHDMLGTSIASLAGPNDHESFPLPNEVAWQKDSARAAERPDNEHLAATESPTAAGSRDSEWPAPAGPVVGNPAGPADRDDVPSPAVERRSGAEIGSAPQMVHIVADETGQSNVFGAAFDTSGQVIADSSIQLSDGDGVVAHPTAAIGKTGYLAVWEEKIDNDAPADLKGRYYGFGDADLNIAPGLVGAEFSIHAGTSDQTEHSAAVSAYAIENAANDLIEVGFQVAYVASGHQSSDGEFGAVKVARIVVDGDPSDGRSPPLSPATEQSSEPGAAPASEDVQILTLADVGRDPAIAALSDGEQIVTWVKDDGRIDGALLAPHVSEDDAGGLAKFNLGTLNLSDVMSDEIVAPHQEQQVLALQERSFVLVWVADDGDGGFEIVGKHFESTDDGQWTPSDTDVFIRDIRTSKDNERIDFKIWVDGGENGGFTIAYRIDGDDGADYHVNRFGDFDDDHSGPGNGDSSAPALVVVLDATDDLSFDFLALKSETVRPVDADEDDGSAGSESENDGLHNSDSGDRDFASTGSHDAPAEPGLPDPQKIDDRTHDIWQT